MPGVRCVVRCLLSRSSAPLTVPPARAHSRSGPLTGIPTGGWRPSGPWGLLLVEALRPVGDAGGLQLLLTAPPTEGPASGRLYCCRFSLVVSSAREWWHLRPSRPVRDCWVDLCGQRLRPYCASGEGERSA